MSPKMVAYLQPDRRIVAVARRLPADVAGTCPSAVAQDAEAVARVGTPMVVEVRAARARVVPVG